MNQDLFEWLLLFLRWLHIVVGISWIGASIFFMWLDRTLKNGELWMVHGGGFYRVNKLLMGAVKVPKDLHWFKWESFWTWMSGMALLIAIFYTSGGTFLLDSSVSNITFSQGVWIGVGTLIASWLFYDLLWESSLTKKTPLVGHTLTLIWFAAVTYYLCKTFSGRAAYIHIGAVLGTWMAGNVFLRIIPRQVKMVAAAERGEAVNPDWAKNAKSRSTHNTYFTLPVIFIMLSNHFPSTYGHDLNWLILLLISAAGAAIREYFVVRVQHPRRAYAFGVMGAAILSGLVFVSSSKKATESVRNVNPAPEVRREVGIRGVVKYSGSVPEVKQIALPPGCGPGAVPDNSVLVKDGKIQGVLVRVTKGLEAKVFSDVPSEVVFVDQRDCIYVPRVAAVRVGQTVEFINSDGVFHNVRTIAENNENFNVGMPNKNERLRRVFNKPEIFLQTKCSIHPWMGAYIAVVDHPFFAVTNSSGEFALPRLPDGSYTLEAWHEVFGIQKQEIVVRGDAPVPMEVQFTFRGKK
jgi:uncharacterized membrane protein/plastocyanin